MDKKKYGSTVINANYKASLWMVVAGVMLASNLCLALFVVSADTTEKTIIVPPDLDKPFSIKGSEMSPEYVGQMARYFSQLLLTYQKQNAAAQFETVLRYTDPSVYARMKAEFALDYERISRNDISSVFYLMKVHVKRNKAIIQGELNGLIGSQLVSNQQKIYELDFKYDSGLRIVGFNELKRDSVGAYIQVDGELDELLEPTINIDREPAAATTPNTSSTTTSRTPQNIQ